MFALALLRRLSALIAGGVLLALPAPGAAQGDLLVAPTRVILQGGGSAEVVLNNIGATAATYRIGLELRRMTPDGDLEIIDEAQATQTERDMLAAVRHAPRRITLPPNQPQSVRISARPPEGFPDGEYRVHMTFRAIPPAQPVEAGAGEASASGLTIRLTPLYGVSIPVIVRKGQLPGGADIVGASLVRDGGQTALKVDLARSGARSVYGEIRVVAPGQREPAFLVRGIAIYPELQQRSFQLALNPAQTAALRGPMTVEFREMPEAGGKLIASRAVSF